MLKTEGPQNTAIQCLLALEDVEFSEGAKVSSAALLLAYVIATEKEALEKSADAKLTDIFIQEIRQIVEREKPPSTAEITAEVNRVVSSLEEVQQETGENMFPRIAALKFASQMLGSKLREEVQGN